MIVLDDHPTVAVEVAKLHFIFTDAVLCGQGSCLVSQGGEVSGKHALDDGALVLGAEVKRDLDVQHRIVLLQFDHL